MLEAQHHLDRERLSLLLMPVVGRCTPLRPGINEVAGVATEDVAKLVQHNVVLVRGARLPLKGDVILGGGGDPEPTDAGSSGVDGQQDDRSLPRLRNGCHIAAYIPRDGRRVRGYQGRDVTSQTLD